MIDWARWESSGFYVLFVSVFLGVAVWETFRPYREWTAPTARRWRNHFILFVIANVVSVSALRLGPVAAALLARDRHWGLFALWPAPLWLQCIVAAIAMDLTRYANHRAFHRFRWLWQVHQVHHSDPAFDVSTSLRAHPIETFGMQAGTLAVVLLLGLPPLGVLVTELVATFQSFFEHANASLPAWIERPLRRVLITPDLHRIHHSTDVDEQQRNFGEIFPWWDHLFGTFTAVARRAVIDVGLRGLEKETSLGVGFLLKEPFVPSPETSSEIR